MFSTRQKDEATILVLFNTKFSFIERQTNKRLWTMNLSCRCRPSYLFLASFRRQCRVVTVTRGFINQSHYLLLSESNRSKHKWHWVRCESIILSLWKVWIYRNNSDHSDWMVPVNPNPYSLIQSSVWCLWCASVNEIKSSRDLDCHLLV